MKHKSLLLMHQKAPLEPWYNRKSESRRLRLPKEVRRKTYPLYSRFEFEEFKDRESLRVVQQMKRLHERISDMVRVMVDYQVTWLYHEIKRIIYSIDFRAINYVKQLDAKGSWIPSPFRQLLAKSSRFCSKCLVSTGLNPCI